MGEAYLEVVLLRCPKCKNYIVEPSWLADLEQDIQCARCGKFFNSTRHQVSRRLLKFIVEQERIEKVEFA